ncbi:MAG: hypothetical protein WBX26_07300 [Candidatus Cybelea sp.]
MVWIAFVSPRWSDRALWGAAMTLTAFVLAANLQACFPPMADIFGRTYPDISATTGLVAYGSWLVILRESSLSAVARVLLTTFSLFALLVTVAFPLIDPDVRVVDIVGPLLLAGGIFTFGIFVADRVGVNVLSRRI